MAPGRKPLWEEKGMDDKLILIEGWARDGLTDVQMYENLGVSCDTFYRWKREKSEFSEALKKGKEIIDRRVENALLKRALGYKYEEVTKEDGVETKRVTKEVVPDVTAQIFWLKNRKPGVWRDKQELSVDGVVGVQVIDDIGGDLDDSDEC